MLFLVLFLIRLCFFFVLSDCRSGRMLGNFANWIGFGGAFFAPFWCCFCSDCAFSGAIFAPIVLFLVLFLLRLCFFWCCFCAFSGALFALIGFFWCFFVFFLMLGRSHSPLAAGSSVGATLTLHLTHVAHIASHSCRPPCFCQAAKQKIYSYSASDITRQAACCRWAYFRAIAIALVVIALVMPSHAGVIA